MQTVVSFLVLGTRVFWCLMAVSVICLFLTEQQVGLQCVINVVPDLIYLLFSRYTIFCKRVQKIRKGHIRIIPVMFGKNPPNTVKPV